MCPHSEPAHKSSHQDMHESTSRFPAQYMSEKRNKNHMLDLAKINAQNITQIDLAAQSDAAGNARFVDATRWSSVRE